jgi:glutathionylspermidine synthase
MKDSVIPAKLRPRIWKKANKIHKDNRAFFEWYGNNQEAFSNMSDEAIEQWWMVVLLTNVAFDEGKEYEYSHPRETNEDELNMFIDKTLDRLEIKFKTSNNTTLNPESKTDSQVQVD